jgi:hypothetical protein
MLHILKLNQIIPLYITRSHLNLITIQLDPSKKISSSYNLDSSPDKIARNLEKKLASSPYRLASRQPCWPGLA